MPDATAIFNASTRIAVGDGSRTLFWDDPWIGGQLAGTIAPDLINLVRPSIRRTRTVRDGLQGAAWVLDIIGELWVNAVVQYLKLWTELQNTAIDDGLDTFSWKWTADGNFTSRSAYRAFFFGRTRLPGAAQVWHAFAPFKYQFHAWLALRKRCWTADRLARRGLLTHALCPLCTLAGETMDHLSLQCPFAATIWTSASQRLGFSMPTPTTQSTLSLWWPDAVQPLSQRESKTANSFIILTLRRLWLERNARVFDGCSSSATAVANAIIDDWSLWVSCRRRGGITGGVD
jgi:hypothetical protein